MRLIINIIILFIVSFLSTFILTKMFVKKASKIKHFIVRDMYKAGEKYIPSMGGLAILAGMIISVVVAQLLINDVKIFLMFYFVIFVYALFGLSDDLFAFKRRYDKIFILFILALPMATLTTDTTINLLLFDLNIGLLYPFVFAPMYIMVVSNLINVHAGYNGLSGGTSLIILFFVSLKLFLLGKTELLILIIPISAALLAFMYFNIYPSKVLLGNIGTYLVGGAIGTFIVLGDIELFGVFILMPHIINFIIDTWTLKIMKIPLDKFGQIRKDGTIQSPSSMKFVSLKFFVTYYFKLTEKQAVWILWAFTLIFCILGLFVF